MDATKQLKVNLVKVLGEEVDHIVGFAEGICDPKSDYVEYLTTTELGAMLKIAQALRILLEECPITYGGSTNP